jgi:Gametolysin peptidase M11
LRKLLAFAGIVLFVSPAGALAHGGGLTGTLVEEHGHRANGTQVQKSYALRSSGGMLRLADAQPDELIGQRVQLDDADPLAPGLQGTVRAAGEQRLTAAVAPGPRSLLVILVTTPDAPTPLTTAAGARSAVFTSAGSANALYKQQSAGASSFVGRTRPDGDVAGPVAIGVSLLGCEVYDIANAADAAARTAGFAVEAYDHVLYALPDTAECDFAGLGQLPGRRTWANGSLAASVVAHELGHNLGAHHANSARCTGPGGAAVMMSPSCVTTEYGDPWDVMGVVGRLMSSWHRAQIGQLPAGQELRLKASQTVSLVSSDDFTSPGTRLLVVPRKAARVPVSTSFAVELRSSLAPFDVFGAGDPVTTGVSIRSVPNMAVAAQSQLLDARPATPALTDAPLPVGETMRDDQYGIAIRLNSIAGATANVSVTMPPLVDDVAPAAPTGVRLSGNTAGVAVRWAAASDDEGVDHYDVERNGVVIGSTPGVGFDDLGVAALTTVSYRVITVDTSANRGPSPAVSTVLADATPPTAVPGLRLSASGGQVTVRWSAALDNRAIRTYRVLRNGVLKRDVAGFSFTEKPPKGKHTYAVAAIDTSNNAGPLASALMPSATNGSSVSKPRIFRLSRKRKGRLVTMRFIAKGATGMRAYRGSKRIAKSSRDRFSVSVRVPRRGKRPRVKIVASSWAGDRVKHFTFR